MGDEPTTDVNEITTDIFAEDGVESTTAEESSTEEPKTPGQPEESQDSQDAEAEPEAKEEGEEPAESEGEEEEAEQPKPRSAEARQKELNSDIRNLVSTKRALEAEIAERTAALNPIESPEEMVARGVDPVIARIEASENRAEQAEFNARVAETTSALGLSSLELMKDYPVYDPDSEDYDQELTARVEKLYLKTAGIKTDPKTGFITEAAVLPYEFYKEFAEIRSTSVQTGQVKGQKAAEKMLANTEVASSAAPKPVKTDPLLELWKD